MSNGLQNFGGPQILGALFHRSLRSRPSTGLEKPILRGITKPHLGLRRSSPKTTTPTKLSSLTHHQIEDGGAWCERRRLGLTSDIVHCAPDEPPWKAMSTGGSQQASQAVSPNAGMTSRCHRCVDSTESRLSIGDITEPKWKRGSAGIPHRCLQGGQQCPRASSPPAPTKRASVSSI